MNPPRPLAAAPHPGTGRATSLALAPDSLARDSRTQPHGPEPNYLTLSGGG